MVIFQGMYCISEMLLGVQFPVLAEQYCMPNLIWAATWQNQHNECAPSEDSDQPGHPPSLIRVFAVRMKKAWVLGYPLSAQRRLIKLGGCPCWSESLLGAQSFCWSCHVLAHIWIRAHSLSTFSDRTNPKNDRTGPVSQSVECPLRGMAGYGFDTGPRYTRVVKMVLAAPPLALRLTG